MRRILTALAFLLLPAAPFLAETLPERGTVELTLASGGDMRSYVAHVPQAASLGPLPLVIVLHGAGGSGIIALDTGAWRQAADRNGFIVLAPDGSLEFPGSRPSLARNPRTWNSGTQTGSWASQAGVDDVGFLRDLIDLWVSAGKADPGRVFVTGFSNGAAMAFRAGAELPDRIAAIAPVANGLLVPVGRLRPPVALILIWGEDDPLNPIAGGTFRRFGTTVSRPGGAASIESWSRALGCRSNPVALRRAAVTITRHAQCAGGTEALFYSIAGLGHQWPGGRVYLRAISGPGSDAIDATAVIWAFFQRHARD